MFNMLSLTHDNLHFSWHFLEFLSLFSFLKYELYSGLILDLCFIFNHSYEFNFVIVIDDILLLKKEANVDIFNLKGQQYV